MSPNGRSSSAGKITAALFLIISGVILFLVCQYHLIYKEQITLFLCDKSFLSQIFSKPACIAVLAGDFLTQFFLLRGLAVILTLLCALLLWMALSKFFSMMGFERAEAPALIPSAVEIVLNCQVEYPVAMTIGALMAVWWVVAISSIRNITLRRAAEFISTAAAFPLIGAHSLLLILLLVIWERKFRVYAATLFLWTAAAFFIESHLYLMMPSDALSYPLIHGYMMDNVLLFLLTEAAVVIALVLCRTGSVWIPASISLSAAAALFLAIHDPQQEYDLKISTMAYFGKWDEVENLGNHNKYLSQTGAYYNNLAHARKGELAKELLSSYQPLFYGLFLPVDGSQSYLKVISSADALIECRDYAQAQHSAMLGMNFTPRQMSSRALRRLTQIALYNGDRAAAERYIGVLEKTLLHRGWAREAEKLLEENPDTNLNPNRDTIFLVNDFASSLRNILESNLYPSKLHPEEGEGTVSYGASGPESSPNRHGGSAAKLKDCSITLDYLLCYDLLRKDLPGFLSDYNRYFLPFNKGIVPARAYQEALEMMEAPQEYCISERVKQENQAFLSGREENFKQSYWFYFKYAQSADENDK